MRGLLACWVSIRNSSSSAAPWSERERSSGFIVDSQDQCTRSKPAGIDTRQRHSVQTPSQNKSTPMTRPAKCIREVIDRPVRIRINSDKTARVLHRQMKPSIRSILLIASSIIASSVVHGRTNETQPTTHTRHPRIINAEAISWTLYQPFVALLTEDDNTHCSGAVIGDYEILTAGHCLVSGQPLIARFNDESKDMKLSPSMYRVHDKFLRGDVNHDVGVIITKKKIPNSAGRGRIDGSFLSLGDPLIAVGVGDIVEDETEWEKLNALGPILQSNRNFGDFVDWIVDGANNVVDGVSELIFGDDYEYDYAYEYDDFISGDNEVVMSGVPRAAVMQFAPDESCFLSSGKETAGLLCTVSETQNTCNGDSGGPVVTLDGYIVGLTTIGSPGCDKSPNGLYESFAVDVDWKGNRDFILGVAGDAAYESNPVDSLVPFLPENELFETNDDDETSSNSNDMVPTQPNGSSPLASSVSVAGAIAIWKLYLDVI